MQELVKVAVDAMGGDHAPLEIVKGAVEAVNKKDNVKVFLVGQEKAVRAELQKYQYDS
ncbi:MAG: phosphate acyltransferase, partial [Lachnospiraceae bacterium]|nr:phosphate acyltransferase [Lachnospiraceae bacterium]